MTSGQPGELAIVMALSMALLSGTCFLLTAIGKRDLFNLAVRAFKVQIALSAIASAWLFYLFLSHDFSIEYVYSYSSTDLPFFYLVSAFWAGQEGTYLLWLMLSSIFGLIVLRYGRQYKFWGMAFYTLVNLFLIFMLMVVSPFKSSGFAPPEGAGLNPLLHDFWMVIHPPVMFVAYAMAAVPFALVLAAMVRRDYSDWLKISFPFVGIISVLLLAANAMGGYWAYKTLGWGGYWAWDPVENTSFVPWVVSLALIHGMLIEKKIGAFRRTNLLLSVLVFLLVVYGTFLTRSGVLADFSVHSFVDLGANAVLISFLLLALVISLSIFSYGHNREIVGKPFNYSIFSREFALFTGMVLLFILGAIVMFWSSLPFITTYLSSTPSAAEIATYNSFALPLAILMSLFLTISPILNFRTVTSGNIKKAAIVAAIIGAIGAILSFIFGHVGTAIVVTIFIYLTTIIIYLSNPDIRGQLSKNLIYGVAGVIVAIILGVDSLTNLIFIGAALAAAGAFVGSLVRLIPKNVTAAGAQMCHFALGIMLVGILASSAYSKGETLVIPRGETRTAFNYDFVYNGLTGSSMEPNNEILLTMTGRNKSIIDARPQFFYVARTDGFMKKPYIEKKLLYDIYLAPMDIQELPDTGQLLLKKGESRQVEDLKITFIDFEMSSHDEQAGISVSAEVEAELGDKRATVYPTFKPGLNGFVGEPVKIFADEPYEIKIERVLASQGAVVLSIPGVIETTPEDQLVLEVSIKPGINLLWLAVLIACAGMILAISQRFRDKKE